MIGLAQTGNGRCDFAATDTVPRPCWSGRRRERVHRRGQIGPRVLCPCTPENSVADFRRFKHMQPRLLAFLAAAGFAAAAMLPEIAAAADNDPINIGVIANLT